MVASEPAGSIRSHSAAQSLRYQRLLLLLPSVSLPSPHVRMLGQRPEYPFSGRLQVYANTVHRLNATFRSMGSLLTEANGLGMGKDIHIIYGPGKELGVAGWRVCFFWW